MSDEKEPKEERSASDLAAIDRASRAGEDDGADNDYKPESDDSEDQKEAYDSSWQKGHDKP